ncbi:tetratricopeptide repeat protein [Hugenholtzia roseola]|uniref:tetratricopeptide repeat protein n=1 Tax=Hugenholtzia roseola TaxID=1002 RepID=UPI0012B61090|nr:tetratricopeptide repeat protein [Hugenholtzia roseola]
MACHLHLPNIILPKGISGRKGRFLVLFAFFKDSKKKQKGLFGGLIEKNGKNSIKDAFAFGKQRRNPYFEQENTACAAFICRKSPFYQINHTYRTFFDEPFMNCFFSFFAKQNPFGAKLSPACKSGKWLLGLMLYLLSWGVQAQKENFYLALKNAQTEEQKVVALNQVAEAELQDNNLDQAYSFGQQALDLALKTANLPQAAKSVLTLARTFRQKKQYASSLRYYLQAIKSYEKQQKKEELAAVYSEVGALYKEQEVPLKALEYYTKAKEIEEESGKSSWRTLDNIAYSHALLKNYDQAVIFYTAVLEQNKIEKDRQATLSTLRSLTDIYKEKQDYEKAAQYNQEIFELNKTAGDKEGMAISLNNLGFLYKFLGKYDDALAAFQQALDLQTTELRPFTVLTNIGVIHQVKGDYTSSANYFSQALKAAKQRNAPAEIAQAYNYLATIYLIKRDFPNARTHAQEAIKIAAQQDAKPILATSFRTMADIYQRQNDYRNAFAFYNQYAALRDTLLLQERNELQASLQRQMTFEKSEKELKLLLVDEEIQDLATKQKQLETEKKLQDLEIQLRDKDLQEFALKNEQLERQRTQQALLLTQQQLEAEKRNQQILSLEKDKAIQDLALKQKELEEEQRREALKAAKEQNKLQNEKLALQEETIKAEQQQKLYSYIALGLAALTILLVAIGFFQQQKARKKLGKQYEQIAAQKYEIEKQNAQLETQKQEILVQNEELEQQQEEILAQRDSIEHKNLQLEAQKEVLVQKNKEVEVLYQNISNISEIGREITSSLDASQIEAMVYANVNAIMPADVFGIGVLEPENHRIRFEGVVEKGAILSKHYDKLREKHKFSVQCLLERKEIVIQDLAKEYPSFQQDDENAGETPASLIYLPLFLKEKPFGVMTVQSFKPNSYSSQEVTMLRALASYAATALDNAQNYELIQAKNRHITDSIRYAQTIQQAVLPANERLNKVLKQYFIVYKPKDIVSGDFYWFSQAEGKMFVAVVDCTGHGVPGAFMSMIGNTILNETVNEKKIYDPAQILTRLHKGVKQALKQEAALNPERRVNDDGMDVVLCSLDFREETQDKVKVLFAGAKRPLIYVLPQTQEAAYVRGDNKSIGGFRERKTVDFVQHEFEFPRNTVLYLTSDGFADQQNPEQIKFGTPRLLQALAENAAEDMANQKVLLEVALENHQRSEEQRDDITILGIKL